MRRLLAALGAVMVGGVGIAAADEPPAVDVADLPPLPPPGDAGAARRIALASAAEVEEELVTGAAKREQSLGNVASAVTVVSGERLRRFGYRTVAEALRAVVGLYVVDDRVTERLGVRGLQLLGDYNTRILVLIDGATVNEPWNQFAGIGWDLPVLVDDIARVEVIRGPVSSVYGTNAFFGIINIVTRSAGEAPRAWARASAGTYRSGTIAAGFALGDLDHQIRGSVATMLRGGETVSIAGVGDDLDADGEHALHAALAGSYQGAFGQLRVYQRGREWTGAPYDSAIGDPDNGATDTQLLAEAGYSRDVGRRLTVTGRAYVNRYHYAETLIFDDEPFTSDGDSFWYGGEVRGRWALARGARGRGDRLGLTAGAELTVIDTSTTSDSDEGGSIRIDTDLSLQGLYAELDGAPLPWLAFTAGLRADRSSLLEDRLSPRAALLLSRGDRLGGKLLYAEGFRNPSTYEAFYEDGLDLVPNPGLRAETIRSLELVLWARPRAGWSTRLSAFRWRADRLVEQETIDVGGEERLQFQNVATLTSTGVEAEASYRDSRGWLASLGATIARVESPDTGERGLNAPAWTATGALSSPLVAGLAHLSSELVLTGARRTRDPARPADVFAGWNVALYAPDVGGFDVTVGVRNLLGSAEDVPAQEEFDRTDPDSMTVPILPGAGREIHARVGVRY
jgi:outer membrane receptor for ferrienterochelin and colicins